MEELVSLIGRYAGYLVIDLLISRFFYAIGWPFVKIATFGRYPKKDLVRNSRGDFYVCCTGAVIFVFSLMIIFGQFNV